MSAGSLVLTLDQMSEIEGRLDIVVATQFDRSRSQVQKWIKAGWISVDGAVRTKPAWPVEIGQHLHGDIVLPDTEVVADPGVAIDILAQTPDWVALDKPAGVLVHPGAGNPDGTLVNGMLARFPQAMASFGASERPGVVHRLDAGTSGVMIWALNPATHMRLQQQFADRQVTKVYVCWVAGELRSYGAIDTPIRRSTSDPTKFTTHASHRVQGREAHTRYWPIAIRNPTAAFPEGRTLLAVQILTGRTHQIRVHLADSGRPVVGDPVYGSGGAERMMLHAWRLSLDASGDGVQTMEAALPEAFGIAEDEHTHLQGWLAAIGSTL